MFIPTRNYVNNLFYRIDIYRSRGNSLLLDQQYPLLAGRNSYIFHLPKCRPKIAQPKDNVTIHMFHNVGSNRNLDMENSS